MKCFRNRIIFRMYKFSSYCYKNNKCIACFLFVCLSFVWHSVALPFKLIEKLLSVFTYLSWTLSQNRFMRKSNPRIQGNAVTNMLAVFNLYELMIRQNRAAVFTERTRQHQMRFFHELNEEKYLLKNRGALFNMFILPNGSRMKAFSLFLFENLCNELA